jgi:hypothetical protein
MEDSRFVVVNLSNGDFFGEMLISDVSYLLNVGMLKKDADYVIVSRNLDIPYLQKFYCIDEEA